METIKRRTFLTGATGLAASAAAAALPAPAIGQGLREFSMVTTWPTDFPGLGTGANRLAHRIAEASGGRFTMTVHGGGELVPALESFTAVANGAADFYHGTESYWQGRSKAFHFFSGIPFGMTAAETNGWIAHGGGQGLWDELSAAFNIKPFLVGNIGGQLGGWFKTPVASLDDLKGRRMRMTGLGAEILRAVGANAVALPGGRIVAALNDGTIDAAEWAGPWLDLAAGLYAAAPYYTYPGFHEPGMALSVGMRRDIWDAMPAADQALIGAAMAAENSIATAEFEARNAAALATLTSRHGVELARLPNEVLNAIGVAAGDVVFDAGNSDGFARRVYESYIAHRHTAIGWSKVSTQAYLAARGLPFRYEKS